jgi:hypothetical protein
MRTRGLEGIKGQEAKAAGEACVGVTLDLGVADNDSKGREGVVQQLQYIGTGGQYRLAMGRWANGAGSLGTRTGRHDCQPHGQQPAAPAN